MRVSHRELEQCRTNLKGWVSARISAKGGIIRPGYDQLTRLAIYKYHATNNAKAAVQHLSQLLKKYRNLSRIELAESNLHSYIQWFETHNIVTAKWKVRISVNIGSNIMITGEVSRIDLNITDGGYQAILIGSASNAWEDELRMPIIQKGVGQVFQRPENEIAVGVQNLNGMNLVTRVFSQTQMSIALKEAKSLSSRIAAEIQKHGGL
jgi:hypothetical protein